MVGDNISVGDVEEYVVIDESDVSKIASDEDSEASESWFDGGSGDFSMTLVIFGLSSGCFFSSRINMSFFSS